MLVCILFKVFDQANQIVDNYVVYEYHWEANYHEQNSCERVQHLFQYFWVKYDLIFVRVKDYDSTACGNEDEGYHVIFGDPFLTQEKHWEELGEYDSNNGVGREKCQISIGQDR